METEYVALEKCRNRKGRVEDITCNGPGLCENIKRDRDVSFNLNSGKTFIVSFNTVVG